MFLEVLHALSRGNIETKRSRTRLKAQSKQTHVTFCFALVTFPAMCLGLSDPIPIHPVWHQAITSNS